MTIQSSITPDERFATPASEENLQRAAGALRRANIAVEIVDTAAQARDLVAAPSVIGKILIVDWEMPGRATVVLVREVLGF